MSLVKLRDILTLFKQTLENVPLSSVRGMESTGGPWLPEARKPSQPWALIRGASFSPERTTERQTALIQTECCAVIFSTVNEVSLSHQDKQLTVFAANDKI